jgi:uncharacterized protein YjeT (DUF2065 family)
MEMNPSGSLASSLLCTFFIVAGVFALVWPAQIQTWTLTFYDGADGLAKWNPLLEWMRTSSYIVALRIVGILSIAAGCLVLFAIVRGSA